MTYFCKNNIACGIMVIKRFIPICFLLLLSVCINAQPVKKPSWTTTQPKQKGVIAGVANVSKIDTQEDSVTNDGLFRILMPEDKYKDKAREMALKKIMGSLHLAVTQESLFGKIRGRAEYRDANLDELLVSLFINRIMDTPLIEKKDEWENQEEYWCYVSVREADFNSYFIAFEDSVKKMTSDLWHRGLKYKENGEIYLAATSFAQAMDAITPLFYKEEIIVEDGVGFDLVKAVYDSYMHIYDNIVMSPSVQVIPAVRDEGVPVTFWVTLTQNDVPLKDVAVYADISGGDVEIQPRTDECGRSHFRITNVIPSEGRNEVTFHIDDIGLLDVPRTFATQQFRNRSFPKCASRFELFDPKVSVGINVVPADSSVVDILTALLNSRDDFILQETTSGADLAVNVSLSNKLENAAVSSGKYELDQYAASCKLEVRSVRSDSILLEYSVNDMQVMIPSSRTEKKAARTAYREVARVMARELAVPFSELDYNKRRIYWSEFE